MSDRSKRRECDREPTAAGAPHRKRRSWVPIIGAVGIVMTITVTSAIRPASAQDSAHWTRSSEESTPVTTTAWADSIWRNALAGHADVVVDRLQGLPAEHADPDIQRLSSEVSVFFHNLDAQLQDRIDSYNKAISNLEDHLEKKEYRDALADALTAHEMALAEHELLASNPKASTLPSQSDVLRDPRVIALISNAESAARKAERAGNWLTAQDYYYRLNALVDQEQRYERDLERTSRRVQLLGIYVPRRLQQLSNEHLAAIGEDPRPAAPEDNITPWQDQVEGITQAMAIDALDEAANEHLWSRGWQPLISGGLEALETVLTTNDLAEVFPGMHDERATNDMLDFLKMEQARWEAELRHDRFGTFTVLRHIRDKNDETVHLPTEVIYREFVEGAMASLDKFSAMIWPHDLAMFDRQLQGSYVGVGIQISLDDAYRLKVVTPLEDSPAMTAGVRAGDIITAVDGKSTIGISLDRAVNTITGRPGSTVTLTVERPGVDGEIDVTIQRKPIRIETIKGWRRKENSKDWDFMLDPENGIGYIRLVQQFGPNTVAEFDRAIMELRRRGMQSLILDLRFNPGGLLSQAVELSNRFVSDGVIVETVDPQGRSQRFTARRHRVQDLDNIPLVVLVNEGAASASEIVSGCLKDHGRALLIGTRTYGKGSVQKVKRIAGDSARLRLTSEHYLLPSGKSIHRRPDSQEWGVDPHLLVRMTPEQVADTILLRQECDIIFDPNDEVPLNPIVAHQPKDGDGDHTGAAEEAPIDRNPDRLITDPGYDLQLQTALVILQSKELPEKARHAELNR